MSFDLQPTLTGDLVELRPLRAVDFDALYAAASDPLIWEQHPVRDRYTLEVFRDEYFAGADAPRLLDLGVGVAEHLPRGERLSAAVARRNIARMAQQFIVGTTPAEVADRLGRLWRACSQNRDLAALCGIDVGRVMSWTAAAAACRKRHSAPSIPSDRRRPCRRTPG